MSSFYCGKIINRIFRLFRFKINKQDNNDKDYYFRKPNYEIIHIEKLQTPNDKGSEGTKS